MVIIESLPAALAALLYTYITVLASGKVDIFNLRNGAATLSAFLLFRLGYHFLRKSGFRWPSLSYPAVIVVLALIAPLFVNPVPFSEPVVKPVAGSTDSSPLSSGSPEPRKYRVKLGFEVRNAIMFYANHSLKRRIAIPPSCRIRFGVGIERKEGANPFRLEVFVQKSSRPEPVSVKSRLLDRNKSRWEDITADLSGHAGPARNIIVQVSTSGDDSGAGRAFLSELKLDCEGRLKEPADRPNIVLVVVDTLRADHMSAYGYDIRKTDPFIKTLWKNRGVRFEKAYSPSSWTLPAVASIMTSMYVSEHGSGVKNFKYGKLDRELDTLAEVLSRQGYDTAGLSVSFIVGPNFDFHQGFDTYYDLHPFAYHWQGDKVAVDYAREWLEQDRERPFFIFFHLMDPHVPYCTAPHIRLGDHSEVVTRALLAEGYIRSNAKNYLDKKRFPSPPGERKALKESALIKDYDEEIKRTDQALEQLVAALKENGQLENTLIILTSDHGEEFKDHDGFGHGHTLYQELIHVPLIIAGPMVKNAGRTVSCPVSTLDIMPTVLELTGTPVPPATRGTSLWPLLQKQECTDRSFYSELYQGELGGIKEAVIKDNYKLVKSWKRGKVKTELFDLGADPREKNNLAKDQPDVVKRMAPLAEKMLQKRNRYIQKAKESRLSDKNKNVLKALGYLE